MSFTTVCVAPSLSTRVAFAFLIFYPLFVWGRCGGPAIVSIASCLADWFRSHGLDNEENATTSTPARVLSFVIGISCALLLSLHFVVTNDLVSRIADAALPVSVALWPAAIAAVLALVSLFWLVISRRRAEFRLTGARRLISIACAVATSLMALFSWHITDFWQTVAIHG